MIVALVLVSLVRNGVDDGSPRTDRGARALDRQHDEVPGVPRASRWPTPTSPRPGPSAPRSPGASTRARATTRSATPSPPPTARTSSSPRARSGFAGLVWILPVVALVLALAGLSAAFARWRRATTATRRADDGPGARRPGPARPMTDGRPTARRERSRTSATSCSRSLEDLEREHAAGDVDEHDYAALKDDYTARGRAGAPRPRGRRRPRRRAAPARAGAARRGRRARRGLFAVLAGVLVAQSAGRRDPGDTATGGIRQSITEKLNEAGRRWRRRRPRPGHRALRRGARRGPRQRRGPDLPGVGAVPRRARRATGLTSLLEAATADPTLPRRPRVPGHRLLPQRAARRGRPRARPPRRARPAAEIRELTERPARRGRGGPRLDHHHRRSSGAAARRERLRRAGEVAALGEPAAVAGEHPGGRLLPAQLVVQLDAVAQRGASSRSGMTSPWLQSTARASAQLVGQRRARPSAPAPSARRSSASTARPRRSASGSSVWTHRV